MCAYRISKYNPLFRTENGYYLNDEWTSYSDIGKIFYNKVFTKDDYLSFENKYCDTVLSILKYLNIKKITIENLEIYFSKHKIKMLLNSKDLDFTKDDEKIIDSLSNGKVLKSTDLTRYVKLILRDCFWCQLKNEEKSMIIEFGQDFYIYVYCDYICESFINEYKSKGIFIEKI